MKIFPASISFVALVFLLMFNFDCQAQNKVRWLTLDEALKKQEAKPRKVFIDVYTDWCKFCKKMETQTLSEDKIAKYINENFYPVRFDAEYKEDIVFNGETMGYVKSFPKGYHKFAYEILGGKISLPSIVILDENTKIIQTLEGFKNAVEMDMILQFFGTDAYKNLSWRAFSKTYQNNLPVNNK